MTQTIDKLAKYRRPKNPRDAAAPLVPPLPAAAAEPPKNDKKSYRAYQLSKEAKRHLEVRVQFPDPAECPLNSMITNIQGEWRMGLRVTITYGNHTGSTMVIEIAEENLQEFFRAVQDWKVEWVEAFDPDFHIMPEDEKAPFIRSIALHTKRPEPIPPPGERH